MLLTVAFPSYRIPYTIVAVKRLSIGRTGTIKRMASRDLTLSFFELLDAYSLCRYALVQEGVLTSTCAPAQSRSCTAFVLPSCAATMSGVSLVSVLASIEAPLTIETREARWGYINFAKIIVSYSTRNLRPESHTSNCYYVLGFLQESGDTPRKSRYIYPAFTPVLCVCIALRVSCLYSSPPPATRSIAGTSSRRAG